MSGQGRLHGFESDINRLIDAFALQADRECCLSFQTFKSMFKAGGYAYLHQAYPGCERNTEYAQLLFATALDRLDVPSPTAPLDSPLWLLHAGPGAADAAAAAALAGAEAPPLLAAPAAWAPPVPQPLAVGGAEGAGGGDVAAAAAHPAAAAAATAATAAAGLISGEEHDDGLGDSFIADLLAIFDEATGDDHDELPPPSPLLLPAPPGGGEAPGSDAAAAGPAQPQPPAVVVPLVVKAGAVFALLCLHETQLASPPVAIYAPLPLLQQLAAAAQEFRAAGPPAADALRALRQLLSRGALLAGQFRRPHQWRPQLPLWLAPPPPPGDLSIAAAANRAAARAVGNTARAAAVAAAANAARGLLRLGVRRGAAGEVDPEVHREAVFHVKAALRGLANFRSLQQLCSGYADARRSIFEPLLRICEPEPPPTPPAQQQQQQQEQQAAGDAGAPTQRGRKRGRQDSRGGAAGGRRGRGKRGRAATSAAGEQEQATEPAADDRQQQQQQQAPEQQRVQAQGARRQGVAPEPPELFERGFGAALQALANEEATRMLVLLDPTQNPSVLKRRQQATAEQRELRRLGQAAGAGGGRRAGVAGAAAAPASAGGGRQLLAHAEDLCEAGIFRPDELQELRQQGVLDHAGDQPGIGAARQVLALQLQRHQRTLEVAEEWLSAHDRLMRWPAGEGGGGGREEDMP